MAGNLVKNDWRRVPDAYCFDGFGTISLSVASVGAGVASSTVQAVGGYPIAFKVPKVLITYTGVDSFNGTDFVNVVFGTGSYSTTGVQASQTFTATGTWATNDTVTAVIGGISSTFTVGATTTLTAVAAGLAAAINASGAGALVTATSSVGVVTIVAPVGTAGNSITTTASKVSTSGVITAGGATMSSGTNTTGITLAANDNSLQSSAYTPSGLSTAGGLGIPTNAAAANVALFGADVPINSANTLSGNTKGVSGDLTGRAQANTGWVTATASAGYGVFVPTNYDAVYGLTNPLTLRAYTNATGGSISNLRVDLAIVPVTLEEYWQTQANPQNVCAPGNAF